MATLEQCYGDIMEYMKKFKLILIILVSAALGAFGWWTLSPLFLDKVVNEELDPEIQVKLDQSKEEEDQTSKEDTSNTPSVSDDGTLSSGPYAITGTTAHPASGEVEVIETPEEKLIHYLNYEGTNGPDLYVYLSKDLEAKDFINLGEQKGNKGNII